MKLVAPVNLFLACLTCVIISCSSSRNFRPVQPAADIKSLHLLGVYEIPCALSFNNTTVGGLSGIDYDQKKNLYYFICDDRSSINPARYYTANIFISQKGIDSLKFISVKYLLQPGGNTYPNSKTDPYNTPDPEAIRYNPIQNRIVWSSEGERIIKENQTILADPAVNIITTDGKHIASLPLPQLLKMQAAEKGPRQNSVLEGMCFADNYQSLYVNVEEPLYEDGPKADTEEKNAFIRILKFDTKSNKNTGQFAYKLDPVAYPANPVNAYKINGVPDILSLGDNKLLVIERSFSTGRLACTVKLFITDISRASDISNNLSLVKNRDFIAAEKKLLLNMDDLGIYVDNIEGVTFGPLLPNGKKTLLLVADNNFNPIEQSQVFLFEISE